MFKKLHEKARIGFMLVIAMSLFYAVVWAGLNRTVGPTVDAGYGIYWRGDSLHVGVLQLVTDSLVGKWDIDQTINGEKTFSGDSVIISTGGLRVANADFYGNVSIKSTFNLTVAGGTVSFPANEIGNTEVADIDSTWITNGSIGSTTLKDGGIFSVDVADQTIVKADIDTTSAFVFGNTYHVTSAETDSQFMSKKYIDDAASGLVDQSVKGNHVDSTAEDFVFDDAYHMTSAVADSEYITHGGVAGTYETIANVALIGDDTTNWNTAYGWGDHSAEIHDSLWSSKPVKGVNYSHTILLEDSVATYRFAQEGTYFSFNLLYNFSTNADDQVDSTWFDVLMPSESPDLDSFVVPAYYTSADNADSASLTIVMFKKTVPLGDTTRIYTGSALKTNSVWTHLAIEGGSIDAISGNDRLIILMISKVDDIDTVKYKDPVPYAPQT